MAADDQPPGEPGDGNGGGGPDDPLRLDAGHRVPSEPLRLPDDGDAALTGDAPPASTASAVPSDLDARIRRAVADAVNETLGEALTDRLSRAVRKAVRQEVRAVMQDIRPER